MLEGSEFEGKSSKRFVKGSHGVNQALFNNAGQTSTICISGTGLPSNEAQWRAAPSRCAGEEDHRGSSVASTRLKEDFIQPVTQFGSGWAGFRRLRNGQARDHEDPNGESPLVHGARRFLRRWMCGEALSTSIISNRRPDYLKAFIENLVNGDIVEKPLQRCVLIDRTTIRSGRIAPRGKARPSWAAFFFVRRE